MEVHVSLDGQRDLAGQIYRQLRAAVLDGRLRAGDPLPPTRELARQLSVARNTVAVAYDRLTAEGYLEGRVGAGTFVRAAGTLRPSADTGSTLRPRAIWREIEAWPTMARLPTRIDYDFRIGLPDSRLFPFESWWPLVARELRASADRGYGEPAGHGGLRAAIARHIGLSRAVRCGAGDVQVTSGIQQALDLICRVMLEPGEVVAMEAPGYPPARALFRSLGLRVVGVPVDDDGLCVDAIPADARLVYVTPSHQFPLGMPLSLPRRLALLDWTHRRGAVVVEDDYDSEFRFGGRPIEPLQSLDPTGQVIYVGSFSKVMLPALRIGFVVAPKPLRAALRAAKFVSDWSSTRPTQAALARFIDDGLLARHIRRMRHVYRARYEAIAGLLRAEFADVLAPVPSLAGLHLTAHGLGELAEPETIADVVARARANGIAVHSVAEAAEDAAVRPGLTFGYGLIDVEDVEAGLRKLLS